MLSFLFHIALDRPPTYTAYYMYGLTMPCVCVLRMNVQYSVCYYYSIEHEESGIEYYMQGSNPRKADSFKYITG